MPKKGVLNNRKKTIPDVVVEDLSTAVSRIQIIRGWGDQKAPIQDAYLQFEPENQCFFFQTTVRALHLFV